MSWITDDWRLKLLALLLAALMLGAVAFSQNPPTTKTLAVSLGGSTTVGSDPANPLIILNPPTSINVTFTGLSDVIGNARPSNFYATVDAAHATQGQAVTLPIHVASTLNVTIQQPAPIVVRVDRLQVVSLPVQVIAHPAPGWTIKATQTNPDHVTYTGPASLEDHLTASVVIGVPVVGSSQQFNQPITLQNSNGSVSTSPCTTDPCTSLDVSAVTVSWTAVQGTTSTTVPLVPDIPSQPPPSGYEIYQMSWSPLTVVITGDPATLAKIQRIILPKVDLSAQTTTYTVKVNIPFPAGTSPLNGVQTASITYVIQRNPSVSPSPSP